MTADRIIGESLSSRMQLRLSLESIYFIIDIKRQLHESSYLRSIQDSSTIIGEYRYLFIDMPLL